GCPALVTPSHQPFFFGKPSHDHNRTGVAVTRNFRILMHNALWNPVFIVIDIAKQREISLRLNSYVFEFDCLFGHESTLKHVLVGLRAISLFTMPNRFRWSLNEILSPKYSAANNIIATAIKSPSPITVGKLSSLNQRKAISETANQTM